MAGLILGPIVVAFSWFGQTDWVVNRIVEGFIRSGQATDLDRDVHVRRLKRVPIVGMAMGVFVFGLCLEDLLFP
ncbi:MULTISPECIES: hypothetical protein [unclassified Kribbella]|uniref:hypothetical protein n=1 Tax=unclassified Kribbella TaxID=2644121 RepID=UPI00301ADAE5